MEIHKALSKAPYLPKAYHSWITKSAWYLYKYTRPNPKYIYMDGIGIRIFGTIQIWSFWNIYICTKYATTYPEGFVMTSLYCLALFLLLCVYHLLSAIALSLASKQVQASSFAIWSHKRVPLSDNFEALMRIVGWLYPLEVSVCIWKSSSRRRKSSSKREERHYFPKDRIESLWTTKICRLQQSHRWHIK